MSKQFSPAADRNKQFILDALQPELSQADEVFEIGSGTGQHICHFAKQRQDVVWQPSDVAGNLPGIQERVNDSGCINILSPIELDLRNSNQLSTTVNVCYSANTLHIVDWQEVKALFKCAAHLLNSNGKLCIYGPYRFNGEHISDGNRQFDLQLRHRNPEGGIRDIKDLNALAVSHGFSSARATALPANNHLMIWDCLSH